MRKHLITALITMAMLFTMFDIGYGLDTLPFWIITLGLFALNLNNDL